MFLLVPAYLVCPGQNPQSGKTVVCVCVCVLHAVIFVANSKHVAVCDLCV